MSVPGTRRLGRIALLRKNPILVSAGVIAIVPQWCLPFAVASDDLMTG